MRALIAEQGASRGAVAAVRALGRDGWHVGVAAPGAGGLAAASRWCAARHDVPAAHRDADRFVAGIAAAVVEGGYEVVFGAGEAEVMALSLHRDRLSAAVPYAEHDVVQRALDKSTLEEFARDVGILLPRTVGPADVAVEQPVVVKARRHAAVDRPGAPPRIDTNVVFGPDAARRRLQQLADLGADPFLQEYLDGHLLAYAVVTDRQGDVVADSMQVASRIWPPYAGASCRAQTIAVDPDVAARCRDLLAALGWFGLAELQFVVPAGGGPRLIDFNGRFYGSMALAAAAGANLPAVWARLATDRRVGRTTARGGVRYQWLEGDVRRAWVERQPSVVADVAATVLSGLRAHHSLLGADWRPAAVRVGQVMRAGGSGV